MNQRFIFGRMKRVTRSDHLAKGPSGPIGGRASRKKGLGGDPGRVEIQQQGHPLTKQLPEGQPNGLGREESGHEEEQGHTEGVEQWVERRQVAGQTDPVEVHDRVIEHNEGDRDALCHVDPGFA